jgi:hypothetical protein
MGQIGGIWEMILVPTELDKNMGGGVHVCSTIKNGLKLSLQVPATGRFPSKTVDFTNEIWDMCYQIGDLPKSYGFQKCGTPKYHTS